MSDRLVWRYFWISGIVLVISLTFTIVFYNPITNQIANVALLSMFLFLGRHIQIRKEIKKPRQVGEFEAKTL